MGAMVECLRLNSGMDRGRTKRIGLWSFRLGGGAGRMRHSRLLGSVDLRPHRKLTLGRGIKNASYIK